MVRGWINVARKGRGGQIDDEGTAWTRLPADQLRDQLEREFLVEVSTRSIQRALKELAESNQVRREQRWKHRYRRDYWYALPEYEEALETHRPRTIAGKFKSGRPRASVPIETTESSGQFLTTQNSNTHFSRGQTKNQQPQRRDTIHAAIETCMSMGKRGPLPQSGGHNQKRPAGQGFGAGQSPREELVGTDSSGRPLKAVWVGGARHLVVD